MEEIFGEFSVIKFSSLIDRFIYLFIHNNYLVSLHARQNSRYWRHRIKQSPALTELRV